MPRAGKKIANQHNSRHENGIVAPGRRITKQKSNGYLTGTLERRPAANTPPDVSPSSDPVRSIPNDLANGTSAAVRHSQKEVTDERAQSREVVELLLEGIDGAEDISTPSKMPEASHRRIDVNVSKGTMTMDMGVLNVAMTVLKSCPMRDTLAILIFLLSLPPTFLKLTNNVFALLTFVPPSGSVMNFPTFGDITSSMSPGAPSFTVMLVIDFMGMGLWLCLPSPLQNMIVSWAQAMVATTLGGGYSNKQQGSDSTLWCMGVVTLTYFARYKYGLLRRLHRTGLGRWLPPLEMLLTEEDPPRITFSSRSWWIQNLSNLVAVHLVCQGVTRMVRRWAFHARDGNQTSHKIQDMDTILVGQANPESSGVDFSVSASFPAELRNRASLQSLKEPRERVTSGKRKKKQGIYVRSQQPLWAAFAATKATFMREYHQSQVTKEAMGSKAIDAKNLGSAPFVLEGGRIWITLIRSTSFFFDTSILYLSQSSKRTADEGKDSLKNGNSAIDRSKPVYVKVNGAFWASTKVQRLADGKEQPLDNEQCQWTGEVYGLLPASTYTVEFVRSEDDVAIHNEAIATTSLQSDESGTFLMTP